MQWIDIHTHNPQSLTSVNDLYNYPLYELPLADFSLYSVGLHPWYLENWELDWGRFLSISQEALAIGECGLDKICSTDFNLQRDVFEKQIDLANNLKKPLIIHCVKAYNECLELLSKAKVPVIFHGFNKKRELLHQIQAKGYYVSFGAAITQEKPQLKIAMAEANKDLIFLETDNAPISIQQVYVAATEILNLSLPSLQSIIDNNYNRIFT